MIKKIIFWFIAFIITVSAAIFQRMTGPTHPIRGEVVLDNQLVKYKFYRSQEGSDNHRVALLVTDKNITGILKFKRHKSSDAIIELPMILQGDSLYAEFPGEPPAGQIEYQVFLSKENNTITIPDKPVIIRFKGYVPDIFLIPHIIVMFVAMFFSIKAGIDALQKNMNLKWIVNWTLILLALGGLILGPIIQYYAFGVFWTGFPFGTDLTDNKTLIAFIFWVIAFIAIKREKSVRLWVLTASIVLFLVYMIPHSLLGSKIDYSKEQTEQTK
jgi:hypothetical protein